MSGFVLALALLVTGCGGDGTSNLRGTLVDDFDRRREAVERDKGFRLYYLGTSFEGFALTEILHDPDPWRPVSFIYGDCEPPARFGDGGCAPPTEVQVAPACHPYRLGIRPAGEGPQIRGAPVASRGGGLAVYTGNVTVTIFGRNRRRAVHVLRPLDRTRPEGNLPAPTRAALEGRLECRM